MYCISSTLTLKNWEKLLVVLSFLPYVNYHTFPLQAHQSWTLGCNELNCLTGIKTTEQKQSRKRTAHELQRNFRGAWSGPIWICVWASRGGVGGLNHSHSGPACSIFALDSEAPWQPPGSGVTGKGCFYLLMRSVPGVCMSLSPRVSSAWSYAGWGGHECLPSDTNAIFTHLHPRPPSCALLRLGQGSEVARREGVTRISFCPVGTKTNGPEIAVPQSGSALSNKCSHANQQSPHGRRSPQISL